jgi:hypothetical protein
MNTNSYSLSFNTDANTDFVKKVTVYVNDHPELVGLKFIVERKGSNITIASDSFHTISLVHRIFLTYKEETKEITKETKENNKVSYAALASSATAPSTKSTSSSNSKYAATPSSKKTSAKKVDSTGKSSPVVVKKPIHPDIVANRLIARTIGNKGCFMREIQDAIGSQHVQRISVGDKPGNYVYTIYASSQQIADDTYLALQKHEFDIIKECIPHTASQQEEDTESDNDDSTLQTTDVDDVKVSDYQPPKPAKVYPPGTSWVDMMDDDEDDY